MSAILETRTNMVESQSHRIYPDVWMDENSWVAIPPEFEDIAMLNAPYIDVVYSQDGKTILSVVPNNKKPPTKPTEPPESISDQITHLQLAITELYERMV